MPSALTANGDINRNLSMEEFEKQLRQVWFGAENETSQTPFWKWGKGKMDKLMDRPWFLRFTALSLAIILFFPSKRRMKKRMGQLLAKPLDIIKDVPR